MNRLLAASVAILLVSAVAPFAPAAAASDSQVLTSPQSANPLLFSVDVGQGSLKRNSNGLFTLTAQADSVVWFTDRPGRAAGVMTTQAFVRKWAQYGFRTSPPNAALIADGRTEVLELTKPRIVGENLVFTARALPLASVSQGIAHHAKRAQKPIAREFGHGSLFIDDATDCTSGESSTVSAAIISALAGVAGVTTGLQNYANNAVNSGVTPSSGFEIAYATMQGDLAPLSALAQESDLASLSELVTTLNEAVSDVNVITSNFFWLMAPGEFAAFSQAVSSLQSIAAAANQVVATESQQVSQCLSASSSVGNSGS